ncbi:MAG TPA: hypothetical protein VF384_11060 [Planctomycetota bacterium]
MPRVTAIAVWCAITLLCLSRALVVCEGPHPDRAIEFVHAAGDCCDESRSPAPAAADCAACGHHGEHDDSDHGDGGDAVPEASSRGCVDTAFVLEVAPPPAKFRCGGDHQAPVAILPWTAPGVSCQRITRTLPRATGPPRTDQGTDRRRSTVLLI